MQINRRSARGPFDIVGDVHGCLAELLMLISELGYQVEADGNGFAVTSPTGRTLAFVGDLVNRGPHTVGVLRLVMRMVRSGQAICVAGNQDMVLAGALKHRTMKSTPGLMRALKEFARESKQFRAEAVEFFETLPSHCVLDDARLVIAHAGLPERLQGSNSARARALALGGESTGKMDEFGLPVRVNWAAAYRGQALVAFGHTPRCGATLAQQHRQPRHWLRLWRTPDRAALS